MYVTLLMNSERERERELKPRIHGYRMCWWVIQAGDIYNAHNGEHSNTHLPAACPVPRMDKESATAAAAAAPGFPWPSPRLISLPTLNHTASYREGRPHHSPPPRRKYIDFWSRCHPAAPQRRISAKGTAVNSSTRAPMAESTSNGGRRHTSRQEQERRREKEQSVNSIVLEAPVRVARTL